MNRILLVLILVSNNIYAKITEINSISDYKHEPADLYVFDIDNTLISPTSQIGGDQWFSYKIKQSKNKKEVEKNIKLYNFLQSRVKVKPTEKKIVELVNSIESNKLLFITARGQEISKETINLLIQAGFDVSEKINIIFAETNPKGALLKDYLKKNNIKGKVIMFDDKEYNLRSCETSNTSNEFIGYRYGFMDQNVKNFSYKVSELQEKYLFEIIPDELAMKIIGEN